MIPKVDAWSYLLGVLVACIPSYHTFDFAARWHFQFTACYAWARQVHPFTLSGKDDPFRATALCSLCNTRFRMRVISYVAGHRTRSQRPVLMRVVFQNDLHRKFNSKFGAQRRRTPKWRLREQNHSCSVYHCIISVTYWRQKVNTCADPWVKSRCQAFVLANLTDLAKGLAAWPQISISFFHLRFLFDSDRLERGGNWGPIWIGWSAMNWLAGPTALWKKYEEMISNAEREHLQVVSIQSCDTKAIELPQTLRA